MEKQRRVERKARARSLWANMLVLYLVGLWFLTTVVLHLWGHFGHLWNIFDCYSGGRWDLLECLIDRTTDAGFCNVQCENSST